ncbi:hypothetical protein D3C86_1391410 [compost metagenome]
MAVREAGADLEAAAGGQDLEGVGEQVVEDDLEPGPVREDLDVGRHLDEKPALALLERVAQVVQAASDQGREGHAAHVQLVPVEGDPVAVEVLHDVALEARQRGDELVEPLGDPGAVVDGVDRVLQHALTDEERRLELVGNHRVEPLLQLALLLGLEGREALVDPGAAEPLVLEPQGEEGARLCQGLALHLREADAFSSAAEHQEADGLAVPLEREARDEAVDERKAILQGRQGQLVPRVAIAGARPGDPAEHLRLGLAPVEAGLLEAQVVDQGLEQGRLLAGKAVEGGEHGLEAAMAAKAGDSPHDALVPRPTPVVG